VTELLRGLVQHNGPDTRMRDAKQHQETTRTPEMGPGADKAGGGRRACGQTNQHRAGQPGERGQDTSRVGRYRERDGVGRR